MGNKITAEDRAMLGQITTRDESGKHFTEIYEDAWLDRMAAGGYLTIDRPVHPATGMEYDRSHWTVEPTERTLAMFD